MSLKELINTLVQNKSNQSINLRKSVMKLLYPSNTPSMGSSLSDKSLINLANTFSRFAQTSKTYADENGSTSSNNSVSSNLLERQALRAISEVLGRAPGSPDSFVKSINEVFPSQKNGKISFTPSRSAVSLYGQGDPSGYGYSTANNGAMSAGLVGQISAEQATLYRQATIVANDALQVLQGLQPFVPEAETDKVEALRTLVGNEINSLVEEFGRVDEPRKERVEVYLNQLTGVNGHLAQFGDRTFLNRKIAPATIDDESQIAGYKLLTNYANILKEIWAGFYKDKKPSSSLNFSLRLSRASRLLSVIAEGNNNFMSALDSIGFTETERRSRAGSFSTLGAYDYTLKGLPEPTFLAIADQLQQLFPDITIDNRTITFTQILPDITIYDFTDWVDRFASLEGPQYLADSGQYGLNFVTEQANRIFWVLVPVLAHISDTSTNLNLSSQPIVAQALNHERVTWALHDLLNQLNALADQAA
jgi:hypothetical protein